MEKITIASLILDGMVATPAYAQQTIVKEMNGGTCMGLVTSTTYCKFLLMPDGSMVLNKSWTLKAFTLDPNILYAGSPFVGSTDQTQQPQTQTQTVETYQTVATASNT